MAETLAATNINRVQYTGLDFDTHNDDLRSRMQVQFAADYNDFATSSLAIMLLDLVSFGLDTLSFYLDRRASDTYLQTARTRGAVARLTRQLGYKMSAAVSSSVDVNINTKVAQVFPVTIPKGFQLRGPFNLIFEVSEAVVISALSTAVVLVPCYEGSSNTDTFTSDGTSFQVFSLSRVPDGTFVVLGSVSLTVNGNPWTESPLLDFAQSDQYEVGYNDDPPTLRFGNGITGNIPPLGATIDVKYVTSHGLTGIVNKDTITDVVSPLVIMATPITLVINNPAGSIGGDDPEDLTKAKSQAPQVWKARNVAVVRTDYEAISNSYADPLFGRVSVAQAIAVHSAAQDTTLQTLLADIVAQAAAAQPIVNPQTASIRTSLNATLSDLAAMLPSLTSIATKMTQVVLTDTPTALFSARSTKNSAQEIEVEASTVQVTVISGKQAIDAVPTALGDGLTTITKAALKSYFDSINANALSIGSAATTIESAATATAATLGTISDTLDDIGIDLVTTGTLLNSIETLRQAIVVRIGVPTPIATLLFASLNIIDVAVEDTLEETTALTTGVYNHVDKFLASDCSANLVSVPILSKDGAGFYAAPSRGLIRSLQSYLDARKEVTQVVAVESGVFFLIPVVMTVDIGVLPTFGAVVTTAAVIAALDGLLKNRSFGSSLYRSDVVATCLAVPGVGYVNVTILGYQTGAVVLTDLQDTEGNLIINNNRVITKGSVVVTAVALTRTLTS